MRMLYGALILASIFATPLARAAIHKSRTHSIQKLHNDETDLAVRKRDLAISRCNVAANKWSNVTWQSAEITVYGECMAQHGELP